MTNDEKAIAIYEQHGQFAVHDAAESGELVADYWAWCEPCETDSPITDGCCLVCGTTYQGA
jgi:hypothetical protein